jgi:uncharacterized membrane protein
VNTLLDFGRVCLAIPIAVFGIQYLIFGQFRPGIPPVPPWTPGGSVLAYPMGALLIILSLGLTTKRYARLSAVLTGAVFLFCVVVLHSKHLSEVIHKGNERTGAFEPLAFAAGAWVLAGLLPPTDSAFRLRENLTTMLAKIGLYLFAFSMLIFGIQHFMYAAFIATLITPWIPFKLFWTYFTGLGMIAVALAIVTGIYARLACLILAAMFFLWVLVLHAPLVATHLDNYAQWASLFVAQGMGGSSLIVAAATQAQRPARS